MGALLLVGFMLATGRQFPPLLEQHPKGQRLHQAWLYMLATGAVGNTLPFFLFPWAQQYVASGLAGVYMALMPIWTLGLAALFVGEHLTGHRLLGFLLGFLGVVILMGPTLSNDTNTSHFLAQAGLVLATLLYAVSAVIAKRAPEISPRVFSAGMLLCAAILATPVLVFMDWQPTQWTMTGIMNIIGLGIFPTGLGGILIIIVIRRVGASFMAYANYLTPICAILLGAILYQERLPLNVFLALFIVCLGLAISQSSSRMNKVTTS